MAVLSAMQQAEVSFAFSVSPVASRNQRLSSSLHAKPAGAFFNPVPDDSDNNDDTEDNNSNAPANSDNDNNDNLQNKDRANDVLSNLNTEHDNADTDTDNDDDDTSDSIDKSLQKLMKDRQKPSLASQPSTINGIPTAQAGVGFGGSKSIAAKKKKQTKDKPYTAIGTPDDNKPLINDITKPEYDDQGYTLYADEETGEKSRVFEALVEYPCEFTMKIVGANEGLFVEEILQVVAESCRVEDVGRIQHKTRTMGKWTSVTVYAPVQSAEMLYELYENVDKDPRVKFKF